MAISDSSKVDLLWKKIAFGTSKTDSSSAKSGSNETISSPLPIYANTIWAQAAEIPSSAPGMTTGVVQHYSGANRIQGTVDSTSSLNVTWKSGLTDWIPATFDANYSIKVYVGDPQTTGVQIFPDTNNQEFAFDYQSGTLHFLNALPPNITAGVYFVGYRYVGTKGLTGAGAGAKNNVVADIAARDALVGMSLGDLVFVTDASGIATDAGPGEYAAYIYTANGWKLVSSEDSSGGDSRTFSVDVDFSATGTVALVRAGNGARVVSCSVTVETAFDGTFDMTVGTALDADLIMGVADHDVTSLGSYVVTPVGQLDLAGETQLNVYVTGTATVGKAKVTVTYA